MENCAGGSDRVRQVRRHIKKIAGLHRVWFAGEGKFTFAGKDLDDRVLRGSVFGEFLPFGEPKQHDARICGAQQSPAHNAIRRKPGFFRQRHDFCRDRNQSEVVSLICLHTSLRGGNPH